MQCNASSCDQVPILVKLYVRYESSNIKDDISLNNTLSAMSVPKSSMKASRSILQAMKNDLHPRRRNGWSFFFWKLGRWKHCRAEFQSNSYKWGSRTQRRDRSPTKDQIKWVLLQNEWWLVQKPVFTNELSFWKLLWLLYNILHRAGIKLHARRKLTGSGRGVAVVQYFNCYFAKIRFSWIHGVKMRSWFASVANVQAFFF